MKEKYVIHMHTLYMYSYMHNGCVCVYVDVEGTINVEIKVSCLV